MSAPSSLIRQRPQEVLELGGLFWRITQPRSAVGTRMYRQLVALAGERVLASVVTALRSEEDVEAAVKAEAHWGAETALRILRDAHAGEPIAALDLVDLQLALASLIDKAGLDRISDIGAALLWESELMVSRNKQVFTGPDTFGVDRSNREAWERELDAIIPDLATRSKLEVWTFLFLCRPSSAASRTAR